ncbi:hypothetical protein EXIGLDRAFT_717253 [Exidia glandulosa HHB12029]|uniref:Uncharacterized protein n=1 Tax=Exidia glandulosa HHB12029 TaxID=1314781 RepID=A0A165P5K7_EXIGL|nr:hypothetical protein EXIGLDRAFT_717251 [Exidia glandulosa HHB12029]KZW01678.1 hypothetical protein EXIGLDRAFT_717253 [Exidia glandulosa HHB12029]
MPHNFPRVFSSTAPGLVFSITIIASSQNVLEHRRGTHLVARVRRRTKVQAR